MRFIDLFSGIGGFHKALHELGHTCVFASEIDTTILKAYENSWKIKPHGDIRKIVKENIGVIPDHDILCAGFPCQPFSKAGKQLGREDEERGNLFDEIVKILEYRKPKYFILENVPFIKKHDNEETWKYMEKELKRIKYDVDHEIYSPQDFGIPQHRERVFIVGSRNRLSHFSFDEINQLKTNGYDIFQFIEENPVTAKKLPQKNIECLKLWQQFIDSIPQKIKLPGFPIWSMEFGATYPYDTTHPFRMTAKELGKYKGNFGVSLKGLQKKEQFALLPSYARVNRRFPDWKKRYIEQNRKFYNENKKHIQEVMNEIAKLPSQSWQKLEWNVGSLERRIENYILQFRASGIRIKKVDFFPSLVCTNTQIPIIGWQKRYITKDEGLKLQSLEGITLPDNDNTAFKALGNAVNSKIVKIIAEKLLVEQPTIQLLNGHKHLNDAKKIISEPSVKVAFDYA
ncbi:MAG: DNA (cytosine-5-)-methyltransferase [Bacteroidetes bacterium]|nr:DNA (cytosine-5-)-methyltransferase [Bacteroidota bacterium]